MMRFRVPLNNDNKWIEIYDSDTFKVLSRKLKSLDIKIDEPPGLLITHNLSSRLLVVFRKNKKALNRFQKVKVSRYLNYNEISPNILMEIGRRLSQISSLKQLGLSLPAPVSCVLLKGFRKSNGELLLNITTGSYKRITMLLKTCFRVEGVILKIESRVLAKHLVLAQSNCPVDQLRIKGLNLRVSDIYLDKSFERISIKEKSTLSVTIDDNEFSEPILKHLLDKKHRVFGSMIEVTGPFWIKDNTSPVRYLRRPRGLQLFIILPSRKQLIMNARVEDRIVEIKRRIEFIKDVSVNLQVLVFGGLALRNNRTVLSYAIKKNATLRLMIRRVDRE